MTMRVSQAPFLLAAVLLLLLSSLARPSVIRGQTIEADLRGYGKDLLIRSQSFFTGENYLLNLSRLRTRGLIDIGSVIHAEAWLDTELLVGDYLSTPEYRLSREYESPTLIDLSWTVANGPSYAVEQRLFRGFVTAELEDVDLTVGRQRVAWGTGFVWNPTDLLNPVSPTSIERGEKDGIDAARGRVSLGPFSYADLVVAPGPGFDTWNVAGRTGTTVDSYDVSGMAGHIRGKTVLGGDFAGYLGGAGIRGEVAGMWTEFEVPDVRVVLNADYMFPNNFYVMGEVYYNGPGARQVDKYDYEGLLTGEQVSLATRYAAALIQKSITPLLSGQSYVLMNFDDGSGLAGPGVTYSVLQNLEVGASAYVFFGPEHSEYGALSNTYFLYGQYFF